MHGVTTWCAPAPAAGSFAWHDGEPQGPGLGRMAVTGIWPARGSCFQISVLLHRRLIDCSLAPHSKCATPQRTLTPKSRSGTSQLPSRLSSTPARQARWDQCDADSLLALVQDPQSFPEKSLRDQTATERACTRNRQAAALQYLTNAIHQACSPVGTSKQFLCQPRCSTNPACGPWLPMAANPDLGSRQLILLVQRMWPGPGLTSM